MVEKHLKEAGFDYTTKAIHKSEKRILEELNYQVSFSINMNII